MNAALGSAGVTLGLVSALLGTATVAIGLVRHQPSYVRLGRWYAWLVLAGAVLAFVAMERALLTNDFTVKFVYDNGSTRTPFPFNVAALWSALEGSIILWTLILAGYLVLVVRKFRNRLADPLVGWALLTMLVVAAFFFYLLVGPANPFHTVVPAVGYDGPGPNPLLQNHILMAIHPPMLYLGYVGFTVPFAFAIAALVTGRVGEGWLVETRRWTLFAWGFLTVGIVLGAWWSYEVLGWGGYWAWDPVENASFLPWLTGTAYIHSVMVQERRGMLRVWNLSLLCATFALTILGTFITRSGVLDSVHAFSESGIGPAILAFFALTVAVTVGLIAWRGDRLRSPGRIDSPISREGAFLANNVLFAGFAFVVLLGTVFPLLIEAVDGNRITVGTPYFNRMTGPIGLTLLFLMAVAPVLPWRKASGELLRERLLWPAWIGAATMVLALVLGARGVAPLIAFGLAGFGGGSAMRQIVLATRRQGWRGFVGRANGGMIVHLGVVIIAVAFAASASYVQQADLKLAKGETVTVAGHEITYLGVVDVPLANRVVTQARVLIDGTGPWEPALNRFGNGQALVGTPSVRSTAVGDVMLTLLALPDKPDDPVNLRVITQPLIVWLWIGGMVMAFGTILACIPSKLWRRPTDPVSAPLPDLRAPAGSATAARDAAARPEPDADGDDRTPTGDDDAGEPDERPERVGGALMTTVQEHTSGPGPDDELGGSGDEGWGGSGDDGPARGGHPARIAAIVVGVVLLLFVVVLATRKPSADTVIANPLVGKAVPAVTGTTLDGTRFDLDTRRGEWVVVNFFAPWCVPCQIEHPELVRFSEAHQATGDASVVSVAFDSEPEALTRFFAEKGGDWPVVISDDGHAPLDFGVTGVPESFLVDPNGVVVAHFFGVTQAGLDEVIASYGGGGGPGTTLAGTGARAGSAAGSGAGGPAATAVAP